MKAPTVGLSSDDIGREFDAPGKWVIKDYLVMNVGVGHFSPGTLMRENNQGAPQTLAYIGFTYRFKVNHHFEVGRRNPGDFTRRRLKGLGTKYFIYQFGGIICDELRKGRWRINK